MPLISEIEAETYETTFGEELWKIATEKEHLVHFTDSVSYMGNTSLLFENYLYEGSFKSTLTSPVLKMPKNDTILISFIYAYSRKSLRSEDKVEFKISSNCGYSWENFYEISSTNLVTNSLKYQSEEFYPNDEQWLERTYKIPAEYAGEKVKIRVRVNSAYGNNLFIDEIKIYQQSQTSIRQIECREIEIIGQNIEGDLLIRNKSGCSKQANVRIYDIAGKKLDSFKRELQNGINLFELNNLARGTKIVEIRTDREVYRTTIILQ
jgi:hypothetical protein